MLLVKNYWNKKYSYELLSTNHPYKKNTLEATLIEYVITNIEILTNTYHDHDKSILQLLKKRKVPVHLDLFVYETLFTRAIWLARFNGVIRIKINEPVKKTPRFAIYLESGLVNLLHHPTYTKAIDDLCDDTRKNAFYEILFIADEIYKKMQIPQLMPNKINNEIVLKNISSNLFQKIHSLPLNGWYTPDTSTDLNTRGIVHHLGDEMAFICAATQYGEVYIVGHDEMGDMVVLAKTPDSRSLNIGQSANMKDFDYVYGTPKGDSLYPSNLMISLNYTNDTATCKMNDIENMSFSNKYWENKIFLKYAKRNIQTYTLPELTTFFIEKFVSTINKEEFVDAKKSYEKLLKQRTKLLKYYKEYVQIIENINQIAIYYKDDTFSIVANDVIFEKEDEDNFLFQNTVQKMIYYPLSCKQFIEEACLDYEDISFHTMNLLNSAMQYANINNNHDLLHNVKAINKLNEKIKSIAKKVNKLHMTESGYHYSEKFNEHFISEMYKNSQIFYKTYIPFLFCDMINVTNKNTGFFLKEGESAKQNATYIDYTNFLNNLIVNADLYKDTIAFTKQIKIEHLFQDYILNKIIQRSDIKEKYKQILLFNNNQKSFVVSEVIDMQNEYRVFVINNKAVSGSPCYRDTTPFNAWQKGRFDPRLCVGHNARTMQLNRSRVALYAKFVRAFNKEIKEQYPNIKNYVLDVAWSDSKNGVVAIEINDITFSGAYQINMNRVCAAIAQKAFKYEDMERKRDFSFNLLKQHAKERNKKERNIQ